MISRMDFAITIYKGLAIFLFIQALNVITKSLSFFLVPAQDAQVLGVIEVVGPIIGFVIAGVLLWFLAPRIAGSILKSEVEDRESAQSKHAIHAAMLSLFGLFLLADALPWFSRIITFSYEISSSYKVDRLVVAERNSWIISVILRIVFGFWLLMRARMLGRDIRNNGK